MHAVLLAVSIHFMMLTRLSHGPSELQFQRKGEDNYLGIRTSNGLLFGVGCIEVHALGLDANRIA